MRFFVVMMFVCLLGENVQAQENRKEKQFETLNLVELITSSDVIYRLKGFDERNVEKWQALAGNKENGTSYYSYLNPIMGKERIEALKKYHEGANKKNKFSSGELILYLWYSDLTTKMYFDLSDYTGEVYNQRGNRSLKSNRVKFPRYDRLRDDLIWLSRNRRLLNQLKERKLTADLYRFSPHELQFLVMVCSSDYLKHLHFYAETDTHGDMLETLYGFMDYDPTNPEKFPLLNEEIVKKLAEAIGDQNKDEVMFADVEGSFELLKTKMKESKYVTLRDRRFFRNYFINNDEFRSLQNELANVMKDEILARGDIKILKPYLQRMENRKSVADLAVLAEFVQSKTFLEGIAEFQGLILEQLFLRKENEVVWILAPLLKHKDKQLAERVRRIMRKHTVSNLGDNPATWRAWYTEQNK